MSIKYRLKRDIVSRIAANLVFNISEAKSVHIIKNDRCFNGKSLIGILSNRLSFNDIITIKVEQLKDIEIIKQAFNEIGEVIE
jgi:phosphotransferase system HPr-like phosphotransfer protein